jgi:hypothetical protein
MACRFNKTRNKDEMIVKFDGHEIISSVLCWLLLKM